MDELIPLAMAGSQRRPTALTGTLFEGLTGTPETQLLGAAALAGITGLAGQEAEAAEAMPVDPQSDPRAVAPQSHLQRILDGEFRSLLPEWLDLARKAGRRPHPLHLPQLLEIGRSDRSLRPLLAEVVGPRGAWLARHNPAWNYLLGQSQQEEIWETGQATARMDWFASLRQREPERARQLLQRSWTSESAEDRQKGLQALLAGLSMDDEEFLESALDDRSKGVRAQAAQLLCRLPLSRLAQRARARMQSWVQEKQSRSWLGLRQSLSLEIAVPAECSREMLRDGIEPKSPRREVGDKAWWLQQCLAQTPLDLWQASPQELLEAKSDWAVALREGWALATMAQGNLRWANALLENGCVEEGIFAILPHAQQEERLLKKMPQSWLRLHGPYTPRLATAVLLFLRKLTAQEYDWSWSNLLPELALKLPADTPIAEDWPAEGRWRSAVELLISTLQFRQAMNEEMRV